MLSIYFYLYYNTFHKLPQPVSCTNTLFDSKQWGNILLPTIHTKEAISNYYDIAKNLIKEGVDSNSDMIMVGEVRDANIDIKALNNDVKDAEVIQVPKIERMAAVYYQPKVKK